MMRATVTLPSVGYSSDGTPRQPTTVVHTAPIVTFTTEHDVLEVYLSEDEGELISVEVYAAAEWTHCRIDILKDEPKQLPMKGETSDCPN